MKSLIIAEKPSVGRDIAQALNINDKRNGYFENNKYIVTWALGHLVTNATPEQYDNNYKEWKLNDLPIIPNRMKTVVISKTKKQFSIVQSLINNKNTKDIIIATDAGREGELGAGLILDKSNKNKNKKKVIIATDAVREGELVARLILNKSHNKKPIKRLWISSVTKKAIKDGFSKLQDGRKFNNLYYAALARSEADWIVGINATRALTTKYDAQLSLGRVQTPTIQLVQMRQNEINHFSPQTYFKMNIVAGGLTFQCVTPETSNDKSVFEKIKSEISEKDGLIESINKKHKKS